MGVSRFAVAANFPLLLDGGKLEPFLVQNFLSLCLAAFDESHLGAAEARRRPPALGEEFRLKFEFNPYSSVRRRYGRDCPLLHDIDVC